MAAGHRALPWAEVALARSENSLTPLLLNSGISVTFPNWVLELCHPTEYIRSHACTWLPGQSYRQQHCLPPWRLCSWHLGESWVLFAALRLPHWKNPRPAHSERTTRGPGANWRQRETLAHHHLCPGGSNCNRASSWVQILTHSNQMRNS